MVRTRITKLSNPRRIAKRRNKTTRRTASKRRKMSVKQIKIFGTRAQKAALKRRRSAKRVVHRARKATNPIRRRRRARSTNPALSPLLVTLGTVNPHRRTKRRKKNTMAKTKRNRRRVTVNKRRRRRVASNPVRHRRRRRAVNTHRRRRRSRKNPVVIVTRRTNRRRRVNRRRTHHVRRNPLSLFGQSVTSKGGLKLIGGGLLGVAAAKFLPGVLPASVASMTTSNFGKTAVTIGAAVVAGWLTSKWDKELGAGVYFGGILQGASVALNAFLPSVYGQFAPYATLGGVGDFVPARFPVPQNPLLAAPATNMPTAAGQVMVSSGSLGSAYKPAY